MEKIFQTMLKKAVADLSTLQARGLVEFKVIDKEGGSFGGLVVEQPKKKVKNPSNLPHGTIRNYALTFVKDLKEDEIVSIPVNGYIVENLRGNICSWATTVWGKGTYTTTYNKETDSIEVYRFAKSA